MMMLAAGWRGALLRALLMLVAGSALPFAFAPFHAWWFAP
jgi:apolipoprotein N-acyltransferase